MPEHHTHQPPDEPYYHESEQSNQVKRWGRVLVLIGIVWLVFALASQSIAWIRGWGFIEQSEKIAARTFEGRKLVVNAGRNDVTIIGGDQLTIQVEATRYGFGWSASDAREGLEQLELDVAQDGDTVRIETSRPSGLPFFGRPPFAQLRITVPTEVELTIQTIDGDITLRDANGVGSLVTTNGDIDARDTSGDLKLKSTNGDIKLENYSGTLALETVNGDIRLRNSHTTDVTVSTINGDVILHEISGWLRANTISGDIDIKQARDARIDIETTNGEIKFVGSLASDGDHRVSTINGDVRLRLPWTSNLDLAIDTVSGDIETDFDLNERESNRRTLRGVIGAGGPRLAITTTSGDVYVEGDR